MARSRMYAAVGTLVAALALTVPAFAAEKTSDVTLRLPVQLTDVDNPCTPDADHITMSGVLHMNAKTFRSASGQTRMLGRYTAHANGAAADGTRYVLQEQEKVDTVSVGTSNVFTFTMRASTISAGAAPNGTMRLSVTLTAGGSYSFTVSSDCHG